MTETTTTIYWDVIRYRDFRSLRRPAPVGIIRNGSVKRVYECALCGARDSMDARWPEPKHVSDFRHEHNSDEHLAWYESRGARQLARLGEGLGWIAQAFARETAGVRALGEAMGQIARAAQPLPRGAKAQLRRLGKALAIVGRAAWIHTVRTLEDRAAAQVSA